MNFHDSLLIDSHWMGDSIVLDFEGVSILERRFFVSLKVCHVTNLLIDDKPVRHKNTPLMEGEYAGVLTLSMSNQDIEILVDWFNHFTREEVYREYRITGESISALIGDVLTDS